MNFSAALAILKAGSRVYRKGWNGKGMFVYLVVPDKAGSEMTLPFIAMRTADGSLVPWLASQTDLLADDWAMLV